jgi:transcriptional regulator with XRE-family HTH domain
MAERRYPPNRLLAWERLQHGWSYEELAARVRSEMSRCGETDTGLTANTVRRWETGTDGPRRASANTWWRSSDSQPVRWAC